MSTSETPYDPDLASAVDDDWDDTPIAPRARMPRNTKLLAAVVIAAAAFAGGVFAQRHWGATSSSGGSAVASRLAGAGQGSGRRFGGFGGAAGGTGRTGAAAAGGLGSATIGQVAYLRGTTLYITSTSGNTVKVTVPKGTPVTKSVTTSLKGVRPGDTVVIRGTAGKNGTVTAQSVAVGGAGGGSFAGGAGGFGRSGSGAATGFGGGSSGSGAATGFGGSGG